MRILSSPPLSASTAAIQGVMILTTTGCLGGSQDDNSRVSAALATVDAPKIRPVAIVAAINFFIYYSGF